MAAAVQKATRFELTQRVRTEKVFASEAETRLALVDRIAELPGIETRDRRDGVASCHVDLYLRRNSARSSRERPAALYFCSLSRDGLAIRGLDLWAKHQVLSRGWGKLSGDEVIVFLPRNRRELDTVWKVVRRAYESLFNPSAGVPGSHIISTWDLPKYSRTTLQ